MNNYIAQPQGLLRFLNGLDLDMNNTRMNLLDENVQFVSRFYTPHIQLSELALMKLKEIKSDDIPTLERQFNENTIVVKTESSDLKLQSPRMYNILQTIVLESYAIVNCFVESPDSLRYLTEDDLRITRQNINYVADYLSDYYEYNSIVLDLRDLDLCFGSLELQLPLIKKEVAN